MERDGTAKVRKTSAVAPVAYQKPVEPPAGKGSAKKTAESSDSTVEDPLKTAKKKDKSKALKVKPGQWKKSLAEAIRLLEAETSWPNRDSKNAGKAAQNDVWLRLLYLTAARRKDAARPIGCLGKKQQEFWKHQLYGLGTYIDPEGMPVESRRAAMAMSELSQAMDYLSQTSNLHVHNVAFCTKVSGYGCLEPFKKNEFSPGQEVVLYVEIDNFSWKKTGEGFQTQLETSYQIFDSAGRRVTDYTFPATRDVCRNRRRDYFETHGMRVPRKIYPGEYLLQLTVEDVDAKKFGQAQIRFKIKD